MRYLVFTFMLIFFLGLPDSFAQTDDHFHYGCHYTKSRIAGIPWTAEEIAWSRATLERSDTFDVLHYSINLDVSNFSGARIDGFTEVTYLNKMDSMEYINLDLEALTVDKVMYQGEEISYTHQGPLLTCHLPVIQRLGDTTTVIVYYGGKPMTSSSNFGGFYFENGYAYNLGIGITDKPHNYGRAWFPCFDNFVERSTYEYVITHQSNHSAHCVGTFMGTEELENDKSRTTYLMSQEIPTYLSSIAVSNYTTVDYTHIGKYGEVPIRLIARPNQIVNMENGFENLGRAVDAFEHWFGPHIWERVGFVLTSRGAMEHPTNVAYPDFTVSGGGRNERLMAHELAHMWWGNILTLKTSHDMWIKEANAEYGSHLFTEYVYGHDAFMKQVKDNASLMVRRAHVEDEGYLPLSPMPEDQTYSTHTYNKGAMIIHNLRAYLGDDLFSSGMTELLNQNFYSAIDAAEFRDQLSTYTGYDLTDYFEDWIFATGHPTFEVDSFETLASGNGYQTVVFVEQKIKERVRFCQNIPIEFTFFDLNWNRFDTTQYVSGQFSALTFENLPFEPKFVVLNEANKLNLGFYGNTEEISGTGTVNFPHGQISINVQAAPTPSRVRIEQHYIPADDFKNPQPNARMSKGRHWRIYGDVAEDTELRATINYNGNIDSEGDLFAVSEDSLILIWRPNAHVEWQEHPDYQKVPLPPLGLGVVRIFTLLAGEYAFANGELDATTSIVEVDPIRDLTIFPNPATSQISLSGFDVSDVSLLRILDMNGNVTKEMKLNMGRTPQSGLEVSVSDMLPGNYIIQTEKSNGRIAGQGKLVVAH